MYEQVLARSSFSSSFVFQCGRDKIKNETVIIRPLLALTDDGAAWPLSRLDRTNCRYTHSRQKTIDKRLNICPQNKSQIYCNINYNFPPNAFAPFPSSFLFLPTSLRFSASACILWAPSMHYVLD